MEILTSSTNSGNDSSSRADTELALSQWLGDFGLSGRIIIFSAIIVWGFIESC